MLTKNQRATIYAMMIAEVNAPMFEDDRSLHAGLCYLAATMFSKDIEKKMNNLYLYSEYEFGKLLPELYAQKPSLTFFGYWFKAGEWKNRKKCLINALKLCI